MGRATFLSRSKDYLAYVKPFVAGSTWAERNRKLRYLARTVERLYHEGRVASEDPVRFTDADVGAIIAWIREERFAPGYQKKLITHLAGFLGYLGKPTLERLKAARLVRVSRDHSRPIYVKSDAWVEEALAKLDAIEGWPGVVVRFALAFYYHTGLRVKELRLARLTDLDTREWTFAIEHPKGEGVWASSGEAIKVVSSVRHEVLDFLERRRHRCVELGLEPEQVEPLIPNGFGTYYSEAGWRGMRLKVLREAGLERASYRVLRPSFAQRLKDRGAPIEAVSKVLRHTSTVTTERFYARIRTEVAWDVVEKAWDTPLVTLASSKKS